MSHNTIVVHVVDGFTEAIIAKLLEDKFKEYVPSAKYYFQLEVGEKGSPHLQGWISHDKTDKVFREHMNEFMNKTSELYKGKGNKKAFTKVRNLEKEYGYILKHYKKQDVVKFWTNLSSEELESISASAIPFVEKKESSYQKKKRWHEETLDILEENVVSRTLCNEYRINYDMIPHVIHDRLPKSLDQMIYDRNILGCMYHLENRVPSKFNRKVHNMFQKNFKERYELLFDT